ncbi:MAG TPA: chromosomal replication initiator protein DnaA [Candidatus Paceibacterota bacterium]|nr:chromosomal replication initiator protein DnaA [Candidatus Paceibacterota bacterium]
MLDNKKLWDKVLAEIELSVSKGNFNIWFKPTYILKQEDGVVTLAVPSAFVKDWLVNKFHKNILRILRSLQENIRSLEYTITSTTAPKQEASFAPQPTKELPFSDLYINKEDNLNPRYTFDSFVVGPFNELAYAAAQAIIKKPIAYNPLFIYGNTGLGKTHLMQAIGNHLKIQSNKKIYYITSEKFAQDVVNHIQTNKMNNFKDKYRKYDVLIMDDIQFISNKDKCQEELFHLFNHLHDNNKQIIFSSDIHPNFIPNLEERLKSRFVAGMIVDIPPPDHESRVAILETKSRAHNFSLSQEVSQYLATSIQGNIRELEGILNSLIHQSEVRGRELNLLEIKTLIKNSAKPTKNVSVKDVIKIVAGFYNVEEDSIYDKTRRKEVVRPRQLSMYILREDFNVSYPTIGQKLGGRDHTTVIHSCEKIKNELKVDNLLAQELNQIRALI